MQNTELRITISLQTKSEHLGLKWCVICYQHVSIALNRIMFWMLQMNIELWTKGWNLGNWFYCRGNYSDGKGRNPHIASTTSTVQFHTARAYPMLSAVFVININITSNQCRMVWQADCWHIRQKDRFLGIRLEDFNFPLSLEGLRVKQQNWGSFHFIQTECLLWQTEMLLRYF